VDQKPIMFVGSAEKSLHSFPAVALQRAWLELKLLQKGKLPKDWKSMSSIGLGVCEIRIHRPFEHRVIYVAKFNDAIYVLHAFSKKTQKTPNRHLQQAKKAYEKIKEIRERADLYDSIQ
jgi:phage-related protein